MMRGWLVTTMALMAVPSVWASSHLFGVKFAITNPSAEERPAEQVVIPMSELRGIAPVISAGSLIVTATDAATLDADSAELETTELPSQVDDIDGDDKVDELAFEIDLKPKQTRIVTVTYGEPNRIYRLRNEYPSRTNALFATKIEGAGWESEDNAWRLYFDSRNAIDLFGKRRHSLLLSMFATPEYDYHSESPYGRDIYKIGDALGIGAVGAWVDGSLVKVFDVADRQYRVVSSGPVRAIVELTYKGWKVGGRSVTLHSRITQWSGDRGFYHTIEVEGADGLRFATGLPKKPNVPEIRSTTDSPETWLATYGEQVLMPGATSTEALKGTNLGLAVVLMGESADAKNDEHNLLLTFPLNRNSASWYTTAAWDQEGTEDAVSLGKPDDMRRFAQRESPTASIQSKDAFLKAIREEALRLSAPPIVKVLSAAPGPQSGPPDTLAAAKHKSYQQAIELLKAEIDRTATEWESIATSSTDVTARDGNGFFTEGDDQTGKWQKQAGFSWTGGFWVGELWKMYALTHDEKYRRWAELWNDKLLGQEKVQNHDAGFVYFYSSSQAFEATKNPKYLASAMYGAQRLAELYNPKTHLVAAWSPGGDDSIIDTMMNLQLLWWAWKQTGDEKWKDIALDHAIQSAGWMIRPDGSEIQSVHYNPGNERQEDKLRGNSSVPIETRWKNEVSPGQRIYGHTHQGFTADTAWSRGAAWALYGFTAGYEATHDPRLLQTAQRVADFVMSNLPEDGVPWYDFYDEGVHFRNRDSSAAAIIVGGLLKLSVVDKDTALSKRYRSEAERIAHTLIDRYLTPTSPGDATPSGVLRHGSGTRPADTALIYGQYYLLEDLLALERQPTSEAKSPAGD